jgi:chromate transporter
VSQARNTSAATAEEARAPRHVGLLELFLLFSRLGLSSFGGSVSAWTHRALVQQQRLIDETEFAAALALARILPGANVVNLAVILARRLRGAAGAAAAVLGLLLGPSLAVVGFAILYRRFAGLAAFRAVLEGAAGASVGLMIAMGATAGWHVVGFGIKSGRTTRSVGAAAVVAATFVLVGVLRLPMVPTILCLAPLSIAFAYLVPPAPRSVETPDGG